MNETSQKDINTDKADLNAGYEYLRNRFLRKDARYLDANAKDLMRYQRADLFPVLRELHFSDEQVRRAEEQLKRKDLRVWSGRDVFAPGQTRIVDNGEGMFDLNNWSAPRLEPVAGDARPFLNFLSALVPVSAEREWLLSFFASRYQQPSVKPQQAVILYGRQGTGKSTIKRILGRVFGSENVNNINNVEALVGSFAASNWTSLWIVAEELRMANNGKVYNDLKDLITGTECRGQRKGLDWATFPAAASLLILSNDEPSFIDSEDRRFFIVETPYPWTGEDDPTKKIFFDEFNEWLEHRDGYAIIAGLLATHDCAGYEPMAAALVTEAKRKIVGVVQVGLAQEVADFLADLGREVVSEDELRERFERVNAEHLRHLVSQARWKPHDGRLTVKGKKIRVWLKEGATIKSEQRRKAILLPVNGVPIALDEVRFGVTYEGEDAL